MAAALALLMLLGCAAPALALGKADMRTVRVAFYRTEGFHYIDENGNRSGYAYDLLQAMKRYENWSYEYVGYDKGWADIQQMILDGEIDLAVSAVKTPEREEKFDFSKRPVAQSGACLLVKAGESPYVAGQYESYNGIRIGFIENSSQIASAQAFAEEKGFVFEPVYYTTSGELEAAVLAGKDIDACVTSNMRIIKGTRRLEMFAMQDVHAMVRKGNAALLAEVDHALEQISLYSPGLYDTLFDKYYSVDAGEDVFYTPEESAYIAQCKAEGVTLQIAIVPDLPPYAFIEDGVPQGILYDIAAEILRRTGLNTSMVITENTTQYRERVKDKAVDLQLAMRFDNNYAEQMGYNLTEPYYATDVSRVTRKGYAGDIRTIAVVRDSLIETLYLPTILHDETVLTYDTVDACIRALMLGRCDAVYLLSRTAQQAVYKDETNRLTSVIMPQFNIGFSIGVREDADARLASIFAKAAISLSDADKAAMVLQYTSYEAQPLTLVNILYSNPVFALIMVALLFMLLFAVAMAILTARKRAQERLQNQRLQEALDYAEQANSAKSVFMSRMSHEIRTPLNAIIGYNSISGTALSKARNEREYRQAVMRAMDCLTKSDIASKHLLTVINDVLDMSAIESGKIKIAQEAFDFKSAVSALTVMFFAQAKAKGLNFEVELDARLEEWFVGDQMRIKQVLTNLLSNAVKFTPAGGSVRMAIKWHAEDSDSATLRFCVTDTGIGMSKDFLQHIWQPFEQEDASISRRFGGTGLGLSITKNLVELMGGTIDVESEPDKGSAFHVELTLRRMPQPERDVACDFSGISALIADDDRSTCDYLKLLLDGFDVTCTTVTTGKAAIAAVEEGVRQNSMFTFCLIDWYMPDMNGLETIRAIRALAGPDIPIIVISAYDLPEIEDALKDAGADLFVAKPLFQSTIYDLLANISGRRDAPPQERSGQHSFAGERVLLAEDNKMNMEIARAILVSWGLTVDQAWNGREAADMFCAAPEGTYKAVLMDVHMPEMDGYRATQEIRASGHAEAISIPIIAMTADVFSEDVAKALASGMNAHISKPISNEVLMDTLRKFIT